MQEKSTILNSFSQWNIIIWKFITWILFIVKKLGKWFWNQRACNFFIHRWVCFTFTLYLKGSVPYSVRFGKKKLKIKVLRIQKCSCSYNDSIHVSQPPYINFGNMSDDLPIFHCIHISQVTVSTSTDSTWNPVWSASRPYKVSHWPPRFNNSASYPPWMLLSLPPLPKSPFKNYRWLSLNTVLCTWRCTSQRIGTFSSTTQNMWSLLLGTYD